MSLKRVLGSGVFNAGAGGGVLTPISGTATFGTSASADLSMTAPLSASTTAGFEAFAHVSVPLSARATFGVGSNIPKLSVNTQMKAEQSFGFYAAASPTIIVPTPPNQVDGLLMWLTADHGTFADIEGNTPATDGGNLRLWQDQSGNNISGRQNFANLSPTYHTSVLNGRPVVRFTPGENGKSTLTRMPLLNSGLLPSVGDRTLFMLYRPTPIDGEPCLLSWGDIYQGTEYTYGPQRQLRIGSSSDGNNKRIWPAATMNEWTLDVVVGTGVSLTGHTLFIGYTEATAIITGEATIAQRERDFGGIGSLRGEPGGHFAGDIATLIVFNRALTPEERINVTAYIMKEWGL